ncbi:hypothetical protein FOA52_004965 [Chlamydomonas sp. UWO 241]|nr:hypothetical protein FOA52_004965 [Chlamydomonas sp. UWO 241]
MGIPGYSLWFHAQNADCYLPLSQFVIDHVYIDANSLLHNALRSSKSWEHFHKNLHIRLNRVLESINPRKSVMIAVDGPAPLAKLLTQRERRKKGARDSAGLKAKKGGDKKGRGGRGHADADDAASLSVLTGNALTPGTRFMLDVSTSLVSWACSRVASQRYSHLAIEVSDGTVKGEGEVKILGRMARPWCALSDDDTHAILGDDADLVLMAMVCTVPKLLVINSALNEGMMEANMPVFSVAHLHAAWSSKMLPSTRVGDLARLSEDDLLLTLKSDLVLLTVIAKGNDYLPSLSGVTLEGGGGGGKGLWNIYKRAWADGMRSGTGGPRIVIGGGGGRHGAPTLDLSALASVVAAALEHNGGDGGQAAAERQDALTAAQTHRRAPDVAGYLQGLVWLVHMYLQGECPDFRFYYDGFAPSAAQLVTLLSDMLVQRGVASGAAGKQQRGGTGAAAAQWHGERCPLGYDAYLPLEPGAESPLLPFASAMALLPANCAHLLPEAVRSLMTDESSPIKDVYHECAECKEISGGMTESARTIGAARMKMDAIVAHISGAQLSGDAQHEAELTAKLEEATAESNSAKREQSVAQQRMGAHLSAAHPYAPFPVGRISDAAAGVPPGAFSAAERPMTLFGRSCVLSRAGAGPAAAAPHMRGMHTSHRAFVPPPPPFSNNNERRGGPPLSRFAVEEPELAGMSSAAAAAAAGGDGGAAVAALAAAASAPAVLELDNRPMLAEYVSCPSSAIPASSAPSGIAGNIGNGRQVQPLPKRVHLDQGAQQQQQVQQAWRQGQQAQQQQAQQQQGQQQQGQQQRQRQAAPYQAPQRQAAPFQGQQQQQQQQPRQQQPQASPYQPIYVAQQQPPPTAPTPLPMPSGRLMSAAARPPAYVAPHQHQPQMQQSLSQAPPGGPAQMDWQQQGQGGSHQGGRQQHQPHQPHRHQHPQQQQQQQHYPQSGPPHHQQQQQRPQQANPYPPVNAYQPLGSSQQQAPMGAYQHIGGSQQHATNAYQPMGSQQHQQQPQQQYQPGYSQQQEAHAYQPMHGQQEGGLNWQQQELQQQQQDGGGGGGGGGARHTRF